MPTYEYSCKSCGEHLEVVQSFADDAVTVCPVCDGELRKVFGSIGIVFKGSGFYKTDSRSTGTVSKTAASSDTAPAASTSTDGGSTSTDTPKPAGSPAPAAPAPVGSSAPASSSGSSAAAS